MAATRKAPKRQVTPGKSSRSTAKRKKRTVDADSRPRNGAASTEPVRSWTFLTNHAHVLILLDREPDLVLREVAARVGITERAVQRIVHELEEENFIRRDRVGRRNVYEVLHDQTLRHPIESHRSIGDLLDLMAR